MALSRDQLKRHIDRQIAVSGFATTTGNITLAVSSSGTADSSELITSGNHTSAPYGSVTDALKALPRFIRYSDTVVIQVDSGSFPGSLISGFLGGGTLRIVGNTTLSSVSTGVNTGDAGPGTSNVALVKPSAAANWTVNDLRGKFLKILSGASGGTDSKPVLRPILSNTVDTITIDDIENLAEGDTFEIVDIDTTFTQTTDISDPSVCFLHAANTANIEIYSSTFNDSLLDHLVLGELTDSFELNGCYCNINLVLGSVRLNNILRANIINCLFESDADVEVDGFIECNTKNIFLNDGAIEVRNGNQFFHNITAEGCSANALYSRRIIYAKGSLDANNCTATPLRMESINRFEQDGAGLIGTGNSPYGLQVESGGTYDVVGATITGSTNDIFVEGRAISYTDAAEFNSIISQGTSLIVQT